MNAGPVGSGQRTTSYDDAVAAQRTAHPAPLAVDALFDRWPAKDAGHVSAMAAHALHHEGADADHWQPWLALAAWGEMLQGNDTSARSLGVVSRVYPEVAQRLPGSVVTSRRIENRSLHSALGLVESADRPPAPSPERMALVDEGVDSLGVDDCYGLLVEAISSQDWRFATRALDQLAAHETEAHVGEDWNAELNPGYEPVPAALATLARERGFEPSRLSDRARGWLWPAVESRPGIVPARWPLAGD